MVEEGVSAILVPPGRVKPLADAIKRLASDPALRSSMAAAAKARAAHFSFDSFYDAITDIYTANGR